MARSKILILGGAVALAAVIVGVALFFPAAPPPDEPPAEAAPARPTSPAPGKPAPAAAARLDTDDPAAQAMFEAAATPSAYREVWLKYPNTTWGRRAEEKFRALDATARAAVDRDFDDVRRRAAGLGAAEAVAAWRAYAAKAAPDARAKAEAAAVEVENRDRAAYNEAVERARERAERGAYAEAAALFAALAKGATADVAARCAESEAQLRKAAVDAAAAAHAAKREAALKTAREEAAPKALAALRARRYADALKELAGEDVDLALERAAVERARAFWQAFVTAARAKAGQDVSLLLAGNKRLAGRLEGVPGDKAALRTPEGALEIPLDQVALDQVAAWAIGKAPDGPACLDAAMFFFAEGRDDLASTYLATAKEKGADVAEVERVWRDGLLRAAIWAAAQPKPKKSR
jgi:hypothetical protein